MTGRLASALCDLAIILLPPRRKPWGDAMKADLAYIGEDAAAVVHGCGCVIAAARERVSDFDARFGAALGSLAMLSAGFGIFHIACAARGVDVMLGRRDGFLDALVRSARASPDLVASYYSARPFVVACLFGLGLAHLAVSYCLLRREWRHFLLAWCSALLIAIVAVIVQLSVVWSADGLPSEFLAVLVQAIALPMILLWSNGRHRPSRRRE